MKRILILNSVGKANLATTVHEINYTLVIYNINLVSSSTTTSVTDSAGLCLQTNLQLYPNWYNKNMLAFKETMSNYDVS